MALTPDEQATLDVRLAFRNAKRALDAALVKFDTAEAQLAAARAACEVARLAAIAKVTE